MLVAMAAMGAVQAAWAEGAAVVAVGSAVAWVAEERLGLESAAACSLSQGRSQGSTRSRSCSCGKCIDCTSSCTTWSTMRRATLAMVAEVVVARTAV